LKRRLIVFAKEPKRGKVKTRLKGRFTLTECTELYKAFLKDTIALARKIDCDQRVLAYEASGEPKYLKKIAKGFSFYRQHGESLGEKMHNALSDLNKDFSRAVIIGSDSPTLPVAYINNAFRKLYRSDVVIGPSTDGGYYLIGAKISDWSIFKGIRWSSNSVLRNTINNIKWNKKYYLLDKWYDVDTVSSAKHLWKDIETSNKTERARFTKDFLNKHFK